MEKDNFIKKNLVIFRQGEVGNGFYYVKKGLIKIVSMKSDQKERILDIVGSGFFIGEQAIDDLPYYSTSISHINSVLYYFSKEDIEESNAKRSKYDCVIGSIPFFKRKTTIK